MKKITNIYERTAVARSLREMPNDQCRAALVHVIESCNGNYSMRNRRSIEAMNDIALTNSKCSSEQIIELYDRYKTSRSQYEKIRIRHGKKRVDYVKNIYTNRPRVDDMSILTVGFWVNRRNLTVEEAKEKISKIQSKNSKKRVEKYSCEDYRKRLPHCVEYWIIKGYSLEEAISAKTEFNQKHVRSYENYIKKYGKSLGMQLMTKSQQKRKDTLLRRYGTSTLIDRSSASKASLKLFIPLYKRLRRLGISRDDINWGVKGSREFATHINGKNYFYDFVVRSLKIAIEFNGCFWHARDDLPWNRNDITKEDSLKSDRDKKKAIEKRDFKFITVWEDDDISLKLEEIYNIIEHEYRRTTK